MLNNLSVLKAENVIEGRKEVISMSTYALNRQVEVIALVRSFRSIPVEKFDRVARPLIMWLQNPGFVMISPYTFYKRVLPSLRGILVVIS